MSVTGAPLTRKELREQQATPTAPSPADTPLAVPAPASHRFDAVDGMRGIAIISVLLYHCGWSTRGLFGVDAFFVVSGFLITLLMIREATGTGRIRIGRFYARRAKRLLPSLFITLAAVLLLLWAEGTLTELTAAAETSLASLLQVANWQQVGTNAAYWEQTGQIVPLGQMWSLSVTEQFYLVWPLFILLGWFVSRRRPAGLIVWLSLALVGTALIAPLQYDGTNSDRLYLGTDARVVAFVAGALAAAIVYMIINRRRRSDAAPSALARIGLSALSIVSLVAVVAVSIATSSYHEAWLYQGGLAVVAVGIAVFIATLCFPGNILIRPFSWKPFRVVGVMAYSMFLLHLPVFWLVKKQFGPDMHPLLLFVVGGILTFLASAFLHYLVAEPLRTRTWKPLGATIAIIAGVALVAGLAWYLPIQRVNAPKPPSVLSAVQGDLFATGADVPFPVRADGKPLAVAIIGDSVATNMQESLQEYRTADLQSYTIAFAGCGLFDAEEVRADDGWIMNSKETCWPWPERLRGVNTNYNPDVYILHNIWDAYDQLIDGTWIKPCTDVWAGRYRDKLESFVNIGSELEQPPLILLSNDHARDGNNSITPERLGCKIAVEEAVMASHPNVQRLDLEAAVCPDGACITTLPDGGAVYVDGVHFTPEGLALMAPWLEHSIATSWVTARG